MSRTYIATIMDRHYMNDKAIAFSCNQALIGRYNEENDLFIDKDGNSFCRMCSAESLNGKETFSFANLMDIEELLNYFENNNFGNYGKFIYKNGGMYEGNLKDGKREGKGVYYFPNGDRYEGDFKNDKRDGQGVYYWNDGDRTVGNFANDESVGLHAILLSNGHVVEKNFNKLQLSSMERIGIFSLIFSINSRLISPLPPSYLTHHQNFLI